MRKFIILLLSLFPIVSVNAEEKSLVCFSTTYEEPFAIENGNFTCSNVEGETLSFFQNDNDLKEYFSYAITENGIATISVSDTLKFDTALKSGLINIKDSKSTFSVYIKNSAYVKPSETTTTTTVPEITYTIILNNNGKTEEKKCNVKKDGETCYITLPNLENEGFNGWGTSSTCKNGNMGSTKVNKNETYYACYENKQSTDLQLYLKSLKIKDTKDEEIKFGTFSIKKLDYEFKVLNEVDKLIIEAISDDNIKIEYTGNDNLVVGENEVIIKLTDDNNNTNEYKLKVTRLDVGETISNVNYLKALVIGNYKINFNKSVFNYDLLIEKDIKQLVINAVPLEEENEVEIKNNINLENGSVVEINVLDNEGNVTTYRINIIKENNNLLLFIAISVILLLIVILVILIIVKKNQKNNLVKKGNDKEVNNESVEILNI